MHHRVGAGPRAARGRRSRGIGWASSPCTGGSPTAPADAAKAAEYARRAGQQALENGSRRQKRRGLFADALELRRRRRHHRALRGPDRARRGSAPDRRSGLSRDAARGCRIASQLEAPSSRRAPPWPTTAASTTLIGEVDTERLAAIERRSSSTILRSRLAARACSPWRRRSSSGVTNRSADARSPTRPSRWLARPATRGLWRACC